MLTINKPVILTDQFMRRIDHHALVVAHAMNMRSWLYEDWKGQVRRQRRKLLEARRVPARQDRQTHAVGRLLKQLLVKDPSQGCNRRMIKTEVTFEQERVFRVYPRRRVRRRQQDPSWAGLADREQPLEELFGVALGGSGVSKHHIAGPCSRCQPFARDDFDVDAARAEAADGCNRAASSRGCQYHRKPATHASFTLIRRTVIGKRSLRVV